MLKEPLRHVHQINFWKKKWNICGQYFIIKQLLFWVIDKVINETKENPKTTTVINDKNVQKTHQLVLPHKGDKRTNILSQCKDMPGYYLQMSLKSK